MSKYGIWFFLSSLNPYINYKYQKKDEKGNSVQILIFSDVNLILNGKNEIIADVFHEDANTNDHLPYDSVHPEKNVPYIFSKELFL